MDVIKVYKILLSTKKVKDGLQYNISPGNQLNLKETSKTVVKAD